MMFALFLVQTEEPHQILRLHEPGEAPAGPRVCRALRLRVRGKKSVLWIWIRLDPELFPGSRIIYYPGKNEKKKADNVNQNVISFLPWLYRKFSGMCSFKCESSWLILLFNWLKGIFWNLSYLFKIIGVGSEIFHSGFTIHCKKYRQGKRQKYPLLHLSSVAVAVLGFLLASSAKRFEGSGIIYRSKKLHYFLNCKP